MSHTFRYASVNLSVGVTRAHRRDGAARACALLSDSVYFCTYASACVCIHAFVVERRWAENKEMFLEVHRKTKTCSALARVKLKEIIKSLLFAPFSRLPLFAPPSVSEPSSPSQPSPLLILMEEETRSFHDSVADTVPPATVSIRRTVLLLSFYSTDIARKKGVIIKCGCYFKICGFAHFPHCFIPSWEFFCTRESSSCFKQAAFQRFRGCEKCVLYPVI